MRRYGREIVFGEGGGEHCGVQQADGLESARKRVDQFAEWQVHARFKCPRIRKIAVSVHVFRSHKPIANKRFEGAEK